MKRFLIGSLFIIICGYACNTQVPDTIYSPDPLQPSYFSIDTRKDTLLRTANGTSIFIPANAIKTTKGNPFRLEVKDAGNIADMVLAGLITRSHDQPLSSGGMLQLIPADDPAATIVAPLTIKIPTDRITPGMMLYKGVTGKDSIINWTEPQPLGVKPPAEKVAAGKEIFQRDCAACHSIPKKLTGPPLLHVTAKHSREWLERYIRNNAEVTASGDCYAMTLFEEYNKIAMTMHPLPAKEMDQLLIWIESESRRLDSTGYEETLKKKDSCELYLVASNELLMKAKSSIVEHIERTRAANQQYEFMVNTFGWFNVDAPLEDIFRFLKSYLPSYLSVRVTGPVSEETQVYLVIPDNRVFLPGGLLKDKNKEYVFFRKDGIIHLPQGKEAYIIAVDKSAGHFQYGITNFRTSLQQTLSIALASTSPAAYEKAVRQIASAAREEAYQAAAAREDTGWQMSAPASARWPKPVGYKCGCDTSFLQTFW